MAISKESPITHEGIQARTRELLPAIRERVIEAERMRRQPNETVKAYVDAGLIRTLLPARWGGYELSYDTFVDSVLEIAKVDGSAGWCYSFFLAHAWFLAFFPEQAQRDVWSENPDALLATSFIPAARPVRVDGGYILNGNWPWCSGIDNCSWVMLNTLLMPTTEGGHPEPHFMLVPRSDYEIADTWFVAGQKGTGSNTVVLKDVFVPEHRTVNFPDMIMGKAPGRLVNPGPLYSCSPLEATFTAALVVPVLGATMGAYEVWRDGLPSKVTAFTREKVIELPHIQIRVAEIAAKIDAAELLLRRALDVVRPGTPLSPEVAVRNRRDYASITRLCIEAIEQIYLASGASANFESNPLQRYWRDIHAMAAHAVLNFDNAGEAFGRSALGLPPKSRG
jgi:3-hydroxy-9,10-secoandrosta-1,3,5(10)-triene-9,17-dione monooxygenase